MKTTLSVSIESDLSDAVRAEADRQRRPLSWVVAEAIRTGLKRNHRRDDASGLAGATATKSVRT